MEKPGGKGMVHLATTLFTVFFSMALMASSHITISSSSQEEQKDFTKFYTYDKGMPLEAEETLIEEGNGYRLFKVYFRSVNNERVPALISVPSTGTPPYPCLVMLHGYGGSKEDMKDLAKFAAENGYAIIAIDAQFHGERKQPGKALYSTNLTESRDGIIQTVVDARRTVDYLETRGDIDSTKIGLVGGSMGGILGAIFAGVEPRVKAAVLIVGGGNMSLMIMKSEHPAIPPIRAYMTEKGITYQEIQEFLDPVDPLNFIDKIAPRPLLMHNGEHDTIVPAEAGRQLYERAKQPKTIYWYDAGHDVPTQLVALRTLRWLNENLTGKSTPIQYLILEKMLAIPPLTFVALGVAAVTLGTIIIVKTFWKRKLIFHRTL